MLFAASDGTVYTVLLKIFQKRSCDPLLLPVFPNFSLCRPKTVCRAALLLELLIWRVITRFKATHVVYQS